jgi:dihydroorotate dehydrogenase
MRLRGTKFENAIVSSGSLGFFGDGYSYHHLPPWSIWSPHQEQMTFVCKTTTIDARAGNMRLNWRYDPKDLFPPCIIVDFLRSFALNAVGLSGPGAKALLDEGPWQQRTEPFLVSFMAVEKTPELRLQETRRFVDLFKKYLPHFKTSVGLEVNFSCANVGVHRDDIVQEVHRTFDITSELNIPTVGNFSAALSVHAAYEICLHPACDAVSIANAIAFGQFPELIDWKKLFGSMTSPLERRGFGAGALSGKPILPVTLRWLEEMQDIRHRFPRPLIVGGGIQDGDDAERVLKAGFPAVRALKYGTGFLLRPMYIKGVIQAANRAFGKPGLHDESYPYRPPPSRAA